MFICQFAALYGLGVRCVCSCVDCVCVFVAVCVCVCIFGYVCARVCVGDHDFGFEASSPLEAYPSPSFKSSAHSLGSELLILPK